MSVTSSVISFYIFQLSHHSIFAIPALSFQKDFEIQLLQLKLSLFPGFKLLCPAAYRYPHIVLQNKHGQNITNYMSPNPAMIIMPGDNATHPVHMPETFNSTLPIQLTKICQFYLLTCLQYVSSFLFPTTTNLVEETFTTHTTISAGLLNCICIKYKRLYTWLSTMVTV